ncbi:phasin family protein [Rhizobium sp. G187]|uniref:phasin family protein n=1 Tax=Rhizobium sp. G187 TaxID=3451352 RepID=UPI003EE58443
MINFDEANKKGKEAMDTMLKNYSEVARGFQAIATEAGDYSKKSFQDMASYMEALTTVKSVEAVFELQTSFLKSSYESFVAEATKLSEMYADLAKTAYKPFEAQIGKMPSMTPVAA